MPEQAHTNTTCQLKMANTIFPMLMSRQAILALILTFPLVLYDYVLYDYLLAHT
jgi:hypothetical protein